MQVPVFSLFRLPVLLVPVLASAAVPPLRLSDYADAHLKQVDALPNGGVLLAGWYNEASCVNSVWGCAIQPSPLLEALDSSGNETEAYSSPLGTGNSTVTCAFADSAGNIYIAGQTNSDDFVLVQPLYSAKAPYATTSYVAKISPAGIVFSTFLGGEEGDGTEQPLSTPTAIGADSAGNVYIAGPTIDPNFPVTGATLGTGTPRPGANNSVTLAFITKISAKGSELVYSRFFGGNQYACTGDDCGLAAATTVPAAIAIDASGNLTIAGSTTATNFPLTMNAYQSAGNEFVSRVSADGSELTFSTLFGTPAQPEGIPGPAPTTINSIALDSVDNVYLAGSTLLGIQTTAGALQSSPYSGGFAAELSADGSKLLFATNLGGSNGATISGLTLDSSGNVWVTGNNRSPEFPGMPNTPSSGLDFALELNSSATAIQEIFQLVPGTVTQPPAFDSSGNLLLAASSGALLRLNPASVLTTPAILAVANAAAGTAGSVVAPGQIVTLIGPGLGPANGMVSGPGANGLYPEQLAGVSVQFVNGLMAYSAPILYAGPYQINFQVPFELQARLGYTLNVTTPSGALPPMPIPIGSSIGIFQQSGTNYAAALNADGSINSPSNPAALGSIVSIFATGLGYNDLSPAPVGSEPPADGALWPIGANPVFLNVVQAALTQMANFYVPIVYAGTAPGEINGVAQINLQAPPPGESIQLVNLAGPNAGTSNPVYVYVN